MKNLIFLSLGLVILAISFRSCGWTAREPEEAKKNSTATEIVRRHFPTRRGREKVYPLAEQSFSPALNEIKEAAMAQLPQLTTIRADSQKNAHYPPASLLDGLGSAAQMVDFAQSGGEKALVAARYFEECATSHSTALPVRAVCVRHLWDLKGTVETAKLLESVPYQIKKIAGQLPSAIKRPG